MNQALKFPQGIFPFTRYLKGLISHIFWVDCEFNWWFTPSLYQMINTSIEFHCDFGVFYVNQSTFFTKDVYIHIRWGKKLLSSIFFKSAQNEGQKPTKKVSYRGCLKVGKSSFPKNAAIRRISARELFLLGEAKPKSTNRHHKSHHSGKPIHTLLSRLFSP